MSSIKKISMIALVLLLVGAAGSLLTFRSANKEVSVSEEKVIDNKNITAIQLETGNAHVEVAPTKDTTTKIQLSGKGTTETKQIFTANVEGTTLFIKLKEQQLKIFDFFPRSESLTLKVSLPEKQYASMQIDNNNGAVQIQQLNIKDVKAKTDNGSIELKNIPSTIVNIESDNGKLSLDHVDGTINGQTNNGKISVVTKQLNRPMQLTSDNGNIIIRTEEEPTNVTFNVRVDNGHINILDKYTGNAVIGKGDNLIKLATDNGEITVTK